MKCVSQKQASQLLHNKFIVVLGDSIQRAVYKDLVLLLQNDKYLSPQHLKTKGEMSFEQDCLVEGGCLNPMHNGIEYKEVRQYQCAHHLVRFYFVTRVYSNYVQSILEDFRKGLKPDVVILNSCVWDISRYNNRWLEDYRENLHRLFEELKEVLPEETLVVWNMSMPLGKRIRGGFLIPEVEDKAQHLRYDVIEANFFSGTLADAYGLDVMDLHFQFRFYLQLRTNDGVHWNALAHRKITALLLEHVAQAWGVDMSSPGTLADPPEEAALLPAKGIVTKPAVRHPSQGNNDSYEEEFCSDKPSFGYVSFESKQPYPHHHGATGDQRRPSHRQDGYEHGLPHYFEPYSDRHHQHVMRSRHNRRHYAPYSHHRPSHHYGHY